jgi:apolipoprotein N-acyltransferase
MTPVFPVFCILCSAVLYALSFPPFSFWPLAWIALVPFFIVLTRMPPKPAAAYGMLWGIAMTGAFGWCFPTMVANYFGFSLVVGWVCFLAVCLGLFGVYFSAFAVWLSWFAHRGRATPLLVGLAWGVGEFARANLLWGNPLALLGYSQVSLTRLSQIADFSGPYGVGMLVAFVNASVAGLFSPTLRGRRLVIATAEVVLVVSCALAYGEWRLSQTFTTGEAIPVAIVQAAIERPMRWDPAHRDANLSRYLALTKEVASARPRFIFWPENAVDFYLQEDGPEREAILNVVRDLKVDLVLGGPSYGYGATHVYYQNSVFLMRQRGVVGRYDKIRLLPFAETDQLSEFFSREPLHLKPGRYSRMLRAKDVRIGAFLCFEAMYPDLVRNFARRGAEILVNPSNDDWFGTFAPARHLLDIASVRAIENRRYLVRPTSTGFSAVVDPYGHTVALSRYGAPEVLTASVYPSRTLTPYQRWGDIAPWIAVACFTIFSFLRLRQSIQK